MRNGAARRMARRSAPLLGQLPPAQLRRLGVAAEDERALEGAPRHRVDADSDADLPHAGPALAQRTSTPRRGHARKVGTNVGTARGSLLRQEAVCSLYAGPTRSALGGTRTPNLLIRTRTPVRGGPPKSTGIRRLGGHLGGQDRWPKPGGLRSKRAPRLSHSEQVRATMQRHWRVHDLSDNQVHEAETCGANSLRRSVRPPWTGNSTG